MLNEHARLRALLKGAIAAMPALDTDYWGRHGDWLSCGASAMGRSGVVATIDGRGMAGETVVLEFVSTEPQGIV